MKEKGVIKKQSVLISILLIIFASTTAIVVHANMPGSVNIEDFDSIFVKIFGFPVVVVTYFVLLYIHIVIALHYFGKRSNLTKIQIGLRFGFVFASIYLIGMQEVVVESSPYSKWGLDFLTYELVMGLGDAIPALLLCIVSAYFLLNKRNVSSCLNKFSIPKSIIAVVLFAIAFVIQRAIGYETGIIISNYHSFPIPCYAWTVLFGIVLGTCYTAMYPVFYCELNHKNVEFKIVVLTIGINWVIFNSFIGLIFDGALLQTFLRSGMDTLVFYITALIVSKFIFKQHNENKDSAK